MKKEELEKIEWVVTNPKTKYAVLTMLTSVIRTSGDACSLATANLKPVVLKVLMEKLEDQRMKMKEGAVPKTTLEDVLAVEQMIEYAHILEGIRWPLILRT